MNNSYTKEDNSLKLYKLLKIFINSIYLTLMILFIILFAFGNNHIYMTLAFAFSIVFALSKIIGLYLDKRNEHKVLYSIYIAYNIATSIGCLFISLDISQAKWLLSILILLEIVSFLLGGPIYLHGDLTDYLDIPYLFVLSLLSLFVYPIHEIINTIRYDEEVDLSSIIEKPEE
jgi:hypothetical protein